MTSADVELLEGEQLLSDGDELVYRQATQHLFDGDKLATTAFGPSTADRDMPSYARSTLVTAQEARDWHTGNAKSPSLGVWGVTIGETIASGRHVVDDSLCPIPRDSRARLVIVSSISGALRGCRSASCAAASTSTPLRAVKSTPFRRSKTVSCLPSRRRIFDVGQVRSTSRWAEAS